MQLREQNRQLTECTLRQRNVEIERLNSILASIDQGVIMQDNEGRLVLVNEAARKLLGSIKAFWQSELGTLFNNFREVTAVDSELSPLSEPTRVQINNRIIGAQLAAVADEAGNRLGTIIVLRDVTREALSDRLKDQLHHGDLARTAHADGGDQGRERSHHGVEHHAQPPDAGNAQPQRGRARPHDRRTARHLRTEQRQLQHPPRAAQSRRTALERRQRADAGDQARAA